MTLVGAEDSNGENPSTSICGQNGAVGWTQMGYAWGAGVWSESGLGVVGLGR